MNVVVVGGSGFIGTHLVRALLDAGHDVRVLDIYHSTPFSSLHTIGGVRDKDFLTGMCRGAEVVYNLGVVNREDVKPTPVSGLEGQRNLRSAAHG